MEMLQIERHLKDRFLSQKIKSHCQKKNLKTNEQLAIYEPYLESI